FRRLVSDGRLAIAASALLAVLLAPLVEAATSQSEAASRSVARSWSELQTAGSALLAQSQSGLGTLPRRLHDHLDPAFTAARTEITATGELVVGCIRPPLEALLSPTAPTSKPSSTQGDDHVQPKP